MAKHICPVWVARILSSPVRKLFQNPNKMLVPYVTKGMIVLDIGCAMGFFSLPLAEMVGENGKVICIDVQKKMLDILKKRAQKAGLSQRITTHLCRQDSLGLADFKEEIDFALAFAVVHEVLDAASFFSEVHEVIKPGGTFMVAEPKGHVSESDFRQTISIAEQQDFKVVERSQDLLGRAVLLAKTGM
jgi:ubiquinone/menaquinone biosynthesis C-methylase UbiE